MKVQIKKLHKDAVIPKAANPGDAGYDLTAISIETKNSGLGFETITYNTGIAVKIPDGYVGLLFPRSSIYKKDMIQTNCVGVLDSSYVGEIKYIFKSPINRYAARYKAGERVGQLVIVPYVEAEFEEVDELPETDRGVEGFGSTGN